MNITTSSTERGLYYHLHEGPHSLSTVILLTCVAVVLVSCTLVGNTLVCLAVILVRKLRSQPANYLLVSLAVADTCVGILVMPVAFLYLILGRWSFGQFMCDVWTSADVTLCTASILSLCAISVDRYSAITRPLTYGPKRTSRRMLIYVLMVWVLAVLVSFLPPIAFWKPSEDEKCVVTDNMGYQIYATMVSFYIPATIILGVNYKIFKAARRLTLADRKASAHTSRAASQKCMANSTSCPGIAPSVLVLSNSVPPSRSGSVNASHEDNLAVPLRPQRKINFVGIQEPWTPADKNQVTLQPTLTDKNTDSLSLCIPTEKSRHGNQPARSFSADNTHSGPIACQKSSTDKRTDSLSLSDTSCDNEPFEMIDSDANEAAVKRLKPAQRLDSLSSICYPEDLDFGGNSKTKCGDIDVPTKTSEKAACAVSYHFDYATQADGGYDGQVSAYTSERLLQHIRSLCHVIIDRLGGLIALLGFRPQQYAHECRQKGLPPHLQQDSHAPGEYSPTIRGRKTGDRCDQTKRRRRPRNHYLGKNVSQANKSETRAMKTLGLIMGCFLLCWIPFFTVTLIRALFCSKECFIPGWLESLVLWLGYANSTLNPLLYAKYNKDFRIPFREMLCCRFSTLQSVLRMEEYLETFGGSMPRTSDDYIAVTSGNFHPSPKFSGSSSGIPSPAGGVMSSAGSVSTALLSGHDAMNRDISL